VTTAALLLMASTGLAYAAYAVRTADVDLAAVAFSRADLFRYSAKWWSYLVPPVAHPWLGTTARRIWDGTGVHLGLLEQQVTLGWGIIALGLIAIYRWLVRARTSAHVAHVPILVIVAVAAWICSLSPERTIGSITLVRPSAWLYDVVPMFRSYARFGVIVQLMAALLAGIGVDLLWQARTWRARAACVALVAMAAVEYTVWPSRLWRDVLPTTAHRWVTQQSADARVLDCHPRSQESDSIEWLTGGRVVAPVAGLTDCGEPGVALKLATLGYSHMLVRSGELVAVEDPSVPDGFRLEAGFADSRLYAVTAGRPAVYTSIVSGWSAREYNADWSWRWMASEAAWVVVNTTGLAVAATLDLELSSFAHDRWVTLALNEIAVQDLLVEPARRRYRVGPVIIQPGAHELRFAAAQPPTIADDLVRNGDRRALSIAVGTWAWNVAETRP
jgi:hypothetical protein